MRASLAATTERELPKTCMSDNEVNVKTIQECFPNLRVEDGWLSGRPDYVELLASCGAEVIVEVVEGSYQGQGFVLLKRGAEYGYASYWYGSCSGCDSLQASHSVEEIDKERIGLIESIHWDTDRARLLEHIKADRSFTDSNWDDVDTQPEFLAKATTALTVPNVTTR